MKFSFDIEIDCAIAPVWSAFVEVDNLGRWQENFQSCTLISGIARQSGAIAELRYSEKGSVIVVTETITEVRTESFLAATYTTDKTSTVMVNRFEEVNSGATRWTVWGNFQRNDFVKFLTPFLTGKRRRSTLTNMQRFKLMVESDLEAGKL